MQTLLCVIQWVVVGADPYRSSTFAERTFHICEANISSRSDFTCPWGQISLAYLQRQVRWWLSPRQNKKGTLWGAFCFKKYLNLRWERYSNPWGIWRFFAEPLVSELPDGFRLECELSLCFRKAVFASGSLRQRKKGTLLGAFCLAERERFELSERY